MWENKPKDGEMMLEISENSMVNSIEVTVYSIIVLHHNIIIWKMLKKVQHI